MNFTKGYKTRQRSQILGYLANNSDRHITAEDIMNHFSKKGDKIGKSTIYRYLNVLIEKGVIRKYVEGKSKMACYRYVKQVCSKQNIYHLKCGVCGTIFDTECEALDVAVVSLARMKHFTLNLKETLFYGVCEHCLKEKKDE